METNLLNIVPTSADLKNLAPNAGITVLLLGKDAIYDNLGGFYRWDAASTSDEDTYLRAIPSSRSETGRWVRIFQKAQVLPHGILVNNGGVKTFYASGTTDANGKITLNLTMDNTLSGPAIFKAIWFNDSKCTSPAGSPQAAVTSYVESLSADLKKTIHGYFKANAVTILLSMVYNPFANVGANVPVQFRIEGN